MNGMKRIKQRKQIAKIILKEWRIPQSLIDIMEVEGYLDQEKWNELNKHKLQEMGFQAKHIDLFIDGMEKRSELQEEEKEEPSNVLRKWLIKEKSINNLRYKHEEQIIKARWREITKKDLQDCKWDQDDIKKFMIKQKEISRKGKKSTQSEASPSEILSEWGIPSHLINKLGLFF